MENTSATEAHEQADRMIEEEARVPLFAFSMPPDGHILQPGPYFVQWSTSPDRVLGQSMLEESMQSLPCEPPVIESAGEGHEASGVIQVTSPIRLRKTEHLIWSVVTPLPIAPFAGLNMVYTPLPIEPGVTYAMRFFLRDKSIPSREDVVRALEDMGFFLRAMMILLKNMRLPGRPGASTSQWFAIATWKQPKTYTTDRDPVFFEDLQPLVNEA